MVSESQTQLIVIFLLEIWIEMFQADSEADYQDWTEAMSVLIEKIEKKTSVKVQELEMDKEGKIKIRSVACIIKLLRSS